MIKYKKPISDGLIRGFLSFFITEFITFTDSYSAYIVAFALCLMIYFVIYFLLIKNDNQKQLLAEYLISFLSFLFSAVLIFINYMFIHISIFPQREIWYGDGFVLLFVQGAFVLGTIFFRLVALIIFSYRNIRNNS